VEHRVRGRDDRADQEIGAVHPFTLPRDPHRADGEITTIKVKKDLIEFQLDGGGYGTFGDDTSLSVNMPDVQKSNREKDLEGAIKRETDAKKKRELQRELDDVRNARERENRRIAIARSFAEERKRAQVAERRLQGGSRFNVRFAGNVPATLSPNDIASALAEFVDFSPVPQGGPPPQGSNDAQGGDGLPRKGMLRIDAERQFGAAGCQCPSGAKARCASSRLSLLVAIHASRRTSLRTS
jgi:hypothetical protein